MTQGHAYSIMCTLTPAMISGDERLVADMYGAGMSAVRINTAHFDSVEQLDGMARRLKELLPQVRILIDTKGPEVRTTSTIDGAQISLVPGQTVSVIGSSHPQATTSAAICVNYPDFALYARSGDVILIDDGTIALRVVSAGQHIEAIVERGGALGSKKGVAIAGVDLPLPAVSDHDRQYIRYAAASDCIDEIAHSFVRDAADVLAVKAEMGACAKPVIAKIENAQGLRNISRIIAVSDGILIARGDLTASLGAEAIPAAQASLASATKAAGLPLYLATNILPSMMASSTPSAADLAGISTAIAQGVDVMLLTNETAAGRYPLEAVRALRAV